MRNITVLIYLGLFKNSLSVNKTLKIIKFSHFMFILLEILLWLYCFWNSKSCSICILGLALVHFHSACIIKRNKENTSELFKNTEANRFRLDPPIAKQLLCKMKKKSSLLWNKNPLSKDVLPYELSKDYMRLFSFLLVLMVTNRRYANEVKIEAGI